MLPFCTTDVRIAQDEKKKSKMLREEWLIVKTNPLWVSFLGGVGVSQRRLAGAFLIFWRLTFASASGDSDI